MKEFKPTIFFLLRFGGFYALSSILYGMFIRKYHPVADPLTVWTANHTYGIMKFLGFDVAKYPTEGYPSIDIFWKGEYAISVFEGCNGFILALLFMVFVVAFQGSVKKMLWFIPVGFAVIYVLNQLRLILLTIIAVDFARHMHFFHKYFFTGLIYAVVLLMWFWWTRLNRESQAETANEQASGA
ncbi:exosortase family protein XrtF [Schleiferia thermophila]|jgi:exosortase family protein XrtF|uniref:exosortase family protein XrtF n=1 Tax=Schleiferia thermophila TaxID=884107 RepID=UPI0004E70258|nr:exosortase family protein XrtF [Schleiferia thermophila]KFD39230.1 hypothetical protein AT05_06315 [Schleiferia thermophila str. Yellowstone]